MYLAINKVYQVLYKKVPTIGIWDDHDYALDDGNGFFIHKELAKNYYLDFLNEPIDSERRKTGRSIYTSYTFGNPKTFKTVRIILLDARFYKQSYYYESDPDMLDEEQWQWLENELTNDETFTLIGSGTQVLPVTRIATECWYPKARKRLFELIGRLKKSGVILLSGDIHNTQILKTFCVIPSIVCLI
jgi:alkaline phosphatase D